MTTCNECGKWLTTPFTYGYCGGTYCKRQAHIRNHTCSQNIDDNNTERINYKKKNKLSPTTLIIIITLIIVISSIYNLYKDRDIIITKMEIKDDEILSGEKITLFINVTTINHNKIIKYIEPYFSQILGLNKNLEINIDDKVVENILINAKLNNYTFKKIELTEKNPGDHKINVENSTLNFRILNQSKITIENINTTNPSPRIFESTNITVTIRNFGLVEYKATLNAYINSELSETKTAIISPESNEEVDFVFIEKEPGTYSFHVDEVSTNQAYTITIEKPDQNPFSDIDYYYRVAEFYVNENYEVPAQKDIEGLSNFLHQIKLPTYSANNFDCSECTSIVEWLLEGAGFNAYIVKNHGWAHSRTRVGHAWIQVETTDGIVAVEATSLTTGMEPFRPGIEARPDGTFTEYTSLYIRYKQWLVDHSPQIYDYDPNITFEEWCGEYLIPVDHPIGIASQEGYYSEKFRFESPDYLTKGKTISNVHYYQSINELDWWNHPMYNEINPIQYWN
jgi:hypothetical protein